MCMRNQQCTKLSTAAWLHNHHAAAAARPVTAAVPRPTLLVGLFAPPEDISAASMLETLYFYGESTAGSG